MASKFGPVSPKAYGAGMGSGTGAFIGGAVIGLIQAYGTHKALPVEVQTLILGLCSVLAGFWGAWLQPLLSQSVLQAAAQLAKSQAGGLVSPPVITQGGGGGVGSGAGVTPGSSGSSGGGGGGS